MSGKINSKTVEGLMEFCEYLADKGLATRRTMENWRTATRTVFTAVEGEDFGTVDLSDLDLDGFLARFGTLTRGKYKPESLAAYESRVRNAVDAYLEYVESGQTPKLRKPNRMTGAAARTVAPEKPANGESSGAQNGQSNGDLMRFPFPLHDGTVATLQLPRRLRKDDADRLSAFLRTLQTESQAQIPEHTGEQAKAA
jgi:hypothetical protein